MLTEIEILDGQTQTLEEVITKLNETTDEPVTHMFAADVGGSPELNVAVECLSTLATLHYTISKEGVSTADVQALRAIQSRMAPYARLKAKIALEAYEGLFTPTRSMINQTVSQEAVVQEIGRTLKEWFFIIVDFIIKCIEWSRKVLNSEAFLAGRLKQIDSNVQSMYNQLNDLVKYNATFGRDSTDTLLAIADVVLKDPKLVKSENTLMAFNVKDHANTVIAADKDIDRSVGYLLKDVAALKNYIESQRPMVQGITYGSDIGAVADTLDQMTVASVDLDDFIKAVRTDFWMRPKLLVMRKLFPAAHNIDQVQTLAKEMRSVRRNANFDDLKEVDIVSATITQITEAVKGLERIISYKQNLYNSYYKASATYANFYIRAYETIREEVIKNSAADFDTIVMDRLSKAWENLLNKIGI